MTSFQEMTFSELLSDAEVFVDGDWVESKDQDPNGDVRLIQLADIGDGFYIDKSSRFLNSETAKRLKCTYLKEGDILVARMPDPLGRACIFPQSEMPCVTVVDVCIIRPNQNKVDNRWLMHTINSPVMRQRINEYVTGTTRQRISRGNFSKLKVSVPPLLEQRRIASILDKVDELRQKRQQAIEKLDQLLQATFMDMFGDPVSNPKGFKVAKLAEQVDLIQIGPFGTQLHQEDYIENGIPLINPSHIKNGKIIPNDKLTVSKSKHEELTQYHLRLNDVLLGRRGEMGRCAVVTEKEVGWLCGTGSLFIRPNREKINPFFLELLLSSDSIKKYLENVSQGQTMANLNKSIVGAIPLILPSIEIQNKFFIISEKIDKMKSEFKNAKNRANNLFESLQNQAFSGNL